MSHEGRCKATGARVFYVKDISEDEAVCETHGWVYVDEGHVEWRHGHANDAESVEKTPLPNGTSERTVGLILEEE